MSTDQVPDGPRSLSGRQVPELHELYRRDLFDDFLPFADRFVVDHELGGFMCNAAQDGARISDNKNTWFLGRGIWTYSFLYNHIAREEKYLEIARKAAGFALKTKPEGNDLWVKSVTRDGSPVDGPDTEIYSDLFVAIGFAQFAAATGDIEHWTFARDLALKCVGIYDRPGYGACGPEGGLPAMPERRILGHWMILLWLSSQMLLLKPDPEIEALAARCISAVMDHHYNPDFGLINEYINHDLSRPDNGYAGLVCTGHAIETLWMVMAEALRTGDTALFDLAADRFQRHVVVSWDDVYGGCLHTVRDVDAYAWDLNKYMWVQEEVLTGTLMLVEHRGSTWAEQMFARTLDYVKEHLWLTKRGLPLQARAADRKGAPAPNATNIDIFHNPRHLMMNLLSLERMQERLPEGS